MNVLLEQASSRGGGGTLDGVLIDDVLEVSHERQAQLVKETQQGLSNEMHWHTRIMRDVLLQTDASSGHMVPRPETAVETKAQVAQRRLANLAEDCEALLGIASRPTLDGKELLDGFFRRATSVDLKIPEGIEEALRSTRPLPLLATEWLRDTAAEVPFITLELRSASPSTSVPGDLRGNGDRLRCSPSTRERGE